VHIVEQVYGLSLSGEGFIRPIHTVLNLSERDARSPYLGGYISGKDVIDAVAVRVRISSVQIAVKQIGRPLGVDVPIKIVLVFIPSDREITYEYNALEIG
jgi:hypothetical protein